MTEPRTPAPAAATGTTDAGAPKAKGAAPSPARSASRAGGKPAGKPKARGAATGAARRRPAQGPARSSAPRRSFRERYLRLLPLTICVAVLGLGVRVGEVWTVLGGDGNVTDIVAGPSPAQAAAPTAEAGAPVSEPPAAVVATPSQPDTAARTRVQVASAPPAEPAASPAEHAASPAAPGERDSAALPETFSPTDIELLQRLAERREQLDRRAAELDQREALAMVAEQRVEQKVAELQALRDEIKGLLRTAEQQQDAEIERLVKIYETMKPKEAALIFEKLGNDVLLDVLGQMKETKVAPILAAMDQNRAKEVTTLIAQRNTLPTLPQ